MLFPFARAAKFANFLAAFATGNKGRDIAHDEGASLNIRTEPSMDEDAELTSCLEREFVRRLSFSTTSSLVLLLMFIFASAVAYLPCPGVWQRKGLRKLRCEGVLSSLKKLMLS
jgi:hypothetical protein